MRRINRETALQIINSGKFCTVTFATRGKDSIRVMNGRTGVKKNIKGNAPYRAADHGLIRFYENGSNGGYKSIPIERILNVNKKQVI